jgi:hypothetical protein
MAFWKHREFREGTRALLIDKDKMPRWSHYDVKDVTEKDIKFFLENEVETSKEDLYDISKYPY